WRKGETLSKVLKIGSLEKAEKEGTLEGRRAEDGAPAKDGEGQVLGMTLGNMSPALRQQFGLAKKTHGVVVTDVTSGSDAADKNIKAGDVLMELNQRPVTTAAEVLELIAAARRQGRKTVLMLVDSKGDLRFIALSLEEAKAEKKPPAPPPAPKKK
ncbi:MAG TPA: PDZ domain-containing protein, partial [Alphaproteobacteria bacterium]|nr:PDZ domain-containing protein [Alphaproteobacteria bacterium]